MNPSWKIIKMLEADNSRLGKEAILEREARNNNDILFYGIRYALDNTMTFGIKNIPVKKDVQTTTSLSWTQFVDTLNKLLNRTLTGNAARDEVSRIMELATPDEWNYWYRRILIKDLRCGLSEKTVNKVVKFVGAKDKYLVPVFSCQLAQDSNDQISKCVGEKMVQVKLDGVRVLSFVYPDGNVVLYSRNGKIFENFPNIQSQLSSVSKFLLEPWVFDGEIMSSTFQDLMKQIFRDENVQTNDAMLNLFDMIPMKDFMAGKCTDSQEIRTTSLSIWYEMVKEYVPNVAVVPYKIINFDTVAGRDSLREINEKAITDGYEGIMIKDLSAPYECKRSSSWLKLKPTITLDFTVIGVEEGTGKNQGSLGAILCEGISDGKNITVSVGSGFSDKDRNDIWENRDSVIGQIAEVMADAITKNQDNTYSLRFPRFLRWRGFSAGEKV